MDNSERCFLDWMTLQKRDSEELLQALTITDDGDPNTLFAELVEKNMTHFQEYIDRRTQLAVERPCTYFAPTWSSSLENSLLWLAGYRPSVYIRLLYSLCGSYVETLISEYLDRGARTGNLGELSAQQMHKINDLHCRIIKREEQLTNKQASLQEEMADDPVSVIAKEHRDARESYEQVQSNIQKYEGAMFGILQEADNLRLTTLKELVSILTPLQAVDFLAADKKLHLCLHEWGKRRDALQGRTN
ncbi:protein DOG1-like 3 [Mercurialis annua]|uniref:protein DOG1-like 3 n=1 Tax=Mercurialis annua TaxID=3986 RepID=UPI00215FF67E|nr:protein DOG1-like 3 [Mercurialis annua]